MVTMKRYIIPIFMMLLLVVLTSGIATGCKSKRDIISEYIDKVLPMGEKYLGAMQIVTNRKVLTLDDPEFQAKWFREWKSYIQILRYQLESLSPPREAENFHTLALSSFDKAILGLTELARVYDETAASYSDPPKWEQLKGGFAMIEASVDVWGQASLEMAKIIQIYGQLARQ